MRLGIVGTKFYGTSVRVDRFLGFPRGCERDAKIVARIGVPRLKANHPSKQVDRLIGTVGLVSEHPQHLEGRQEVLVLFKYLAIGRLGIDQLPRAVKFRSAVKAGLEGGGRDRQF